MLDGAARGRAGSSNWEMVKAEMIESPPQKKAPA
jgi:hypothetical protein